MCKASKSHLQLPVDTFSSVYWPVAAAIYLAWSFKTGNWHMTWIIWPMVGILFGVIETVTKIVLKVED